MKRLLIAAFAVVALAAGGVAVAATQGAARERPRAQRAGHGLAVAAASYLGLSRQALRAELRQGRSLAQIASARGKSVDGLEQALLAALRQKVETARAAGRIDAARAARILERAPARIERLVNASARLGHRHRGRGLVRVAAQYLGVTPAALVQELRGGRSLAQAATARGKSAAGLERALLGALKAKLDAGVAAGRLDAARAQRILERAPARIHRLVTRTR